VRFVTRTATVGAVRPAPADRRRSQRDETRPSTTRHRLAAAPRTARQRARVRPARISGKPFAHVRRELLHARMHALAAGAHIAPVSWLRDKADRGRQRHGDEL
jgi:hypothetical protein